MAQLFGDEEFATPFPYKTTVRGEQYGPEDTYLLAAKWLRDCKTVADWGGGRGYFQKCLTAEQAYLLIDGTKQVPQTRMADLAKYRGKSEGILLRHVLEMTFDWKDVLTNAVAAFQKRMVVVTYTPNVKKTHRAKWHLTSPVFHFNHEADLVPLMEPYLVKIEPIQAWPTLPERVYYLTKEGGERG